MPWNKSADTDTSFGAVPGSGKIECEVLSMKV